MTRLNGRFLPVLALIVLACIPSRDARADEDSRFYIAGYMGLNVMLDKDFTEDVTNVTGQMSFGNGQEFAGAIGLKLTPQLRLEGEFSYLSTGFDQLSVPILGDLKLGGTLKSKIAMLNLYYDFDLDWPVQPFVGTGVGYGWHDADVFDDYGFATSGSASAYVWQIGGGLKYAIGDDTNVIAAYRYVDGGDLSFSGNTMDYGSHQFRVGLSWDLPYDY